MMEVVESITLAATVEIIPRRGFKSFIEIVQYFIICSNCWALDYLNSLILVRIIVQYFLASSQNVRFQVFIKIQHSS